MIKSYIFVRYIDCILLRDADYIYLLRNIGCIFGGELPGQKARIKLMLALGKTDNLDEIKDFFEKGIYY